MSKSHEIHIQLMYNSHEISVKLMLCQIHLELDSHEIYENKICV